MPWNDLHTKQVRHLAWACFSKPLLTASGMWPAESGIVDFELEPSAARLRWLKDLDNDPTPLLDWLAQSRSHRLGIYFEQLWSFFLHSDPQFELIAQNLAVRDGKLTVGEFDLLLRHVGTQTVFHLELAVKYYLAAPGYIAEATDANASWIGPGCEDRLDLKLAHLRNHQLRLASHPASIRLLESLGVESVQPALVLKGQLFNTQSAPIPPSPGMSATNFSWVALPNLGSITRTGGYLWELPEKYDWFGQRSPADPDDLMSSSAMENTLTALFESNPRPVLLVAIAPFEDDLREVRRYFVTPGNWPQAFTPKS